MPKNLDNKIGNLEVAEVMSHSPTAQTMNYYKVGMLFSDAITKMLEGHKIARMEWEEEYYGLLQDEKMLLHKPDGNYYYWIISVSDIVATDWIVLND